MILPLERTTVQQADDNNGKKKFLSDLSSAVDCLHVVRIFKLNLFIGMTYKRKRKHRSTEDGRRWKARNKKKDLDEVNKTKNCENKQMVKVKTKDRRH